MYLLLFAFEGILRSFGVGYWQRSEYSLLRIHGVSIPLSSWKVNLCLPYACQFLTSFWYKKDSTSSTNILRNKGVQGRTQVCEQRTYIM